MSNNNIADISTFENLQADQHDRTGVSSMSVFNDASAMVKAAKKLDELDKEYKTAKKRLQEISDTGKKIYDMYWKLHADYQKQIKELEGKVASGGQDSKQAADKLRKERDALYDIPTVAHYAFQ